MDNVESGGAERAECSAKGKNVDIVQAQLRRDRGRVQTAPAAQGQDSRPSQIDAAAMRSDGCRHLFLEGLLDDGGGLRRLCLGCQSRKRAPGEISPQATPATEKTIWGEKAQGETGIGDGGVSAAEVEAGRTRQAAGTLRSEREITVGQSCDRAAAQAQAPHLRQRLAEPVAADLALREQARRGTGDKGDVSGGAADVHGDGSLAPAATNATSAVDHRRRPRGVSVECPRLGHAGAASVGMNHQQRPAAGALAQAILGFA